jgi:hypothetical protein
VLHILNGDTTLEVFERAGIEGEPAVFADVFHEGPLLGDPTDPAFLEARIRHAVEAGWTTPDRAAALYAGWSRGLASSPRHDEVVLWFEHDLYDQLLLVHHIEWLARGGVLPAREGGPRVALICIDRFEGVPDFRGLGQLTGEQLASLFPGRRPIELPQVELARSAWKALCAGDPREIEAMLADDRTALPFLQAALRRLIEELPDRRAGLSRTERQALRAVQGGAVTPTDAFRASTAMEECVFMGDATFLCVLRRLASATAPALAMDIPTEYDNTGLPEGELAITAFGRSLLAGEADWVAYNGVDRWVGGIRLKGKAVRWRWDAEAGRVHVDEAVEPPAPPAQ